MSSTKVLVVNSGSSSIKFQLLDPVTGQVDASGIVERIGLADGIYSIKANGEKKEFFEPVPNHEVGMQKMRHAFDVVGIELTEQTVAAVGHRVVQGGSVFSHATLIDDTVRDQIHDLGKLAPLHNYAAVDGINGAKKLLPNLPHVAVFDTSFFSELPASARNYGINKEVAAEHAIYRYGAHGTSHDYVSHEVAAFLGRDLADTNTIVMHLGNGASASAVQGGHPIDTSMGLTPLEGLVMGTRSGDIDPSVYVHLFRQAQMSPEEVDTLLNKKSGMMGLCGFSDFRDIEDEVEKGNPDASVAVDVYVHRLKKYIGAYSFLMGRLDVLAFTAGIGENASFIRERACQGLKGFGIVLDADKNALRTGEPQIISAEDSAVTVVVFPTNEELAIARHTVEVAGLA
ncbi:acetate/propionate family kinase [Devriesea agamarum]|uniref:acetate/propionate family kinase n=1 Tax=Devriesea agamarum TaxID=472569 RepID=UPI00071D2E2D|nr:acetate kinase [Devriesea agamarum]